MFRCRWRRRKARTRFGNSAGRSTKGGWRNIRMSRRSKPRRSSRRSANGIARSAPRKPSDAATRAMKHDFNDLRLDRVTRRFAGAGGHAFAALDELTLTVKRGEFICLLGPSGCGKSTALNCIAGLMQLSGGSIWLDDQRIDTLPPEKRGFGMVFQNYALFPHMTVAKNIGFGLRMRGVSAAESAPRVAHALKLVQLNGQEHKLPGQLSGGQQQRVAIARAIATRCC